MIASAIPSRPQATASLSLPAECPADGIAGSSRANCADSAKRFEGDVPAIDGRRAFVVEQIDYGKERRRVDAALATHFVHRAVAEPQSDTEPAHDEQDMVIAAYQIAHPVRSRIFPEPVHNGISFRSLQR